MFESIVASISQIKVLRKCMGRPFLQVNESAWNRLPPFLKSLRPVCAYGTFLQSLVRLKTERRQYHGTFFFRNRPALKLIRSLASEKPAGADLRIVVLGCSNGAEVYSIVWTVRSACPGVTVEVQAIDISDEVVEFARKGAYSPRDGSVIKESIFERLTENEMATLFDKEEDQFRIKPWIAQGIHWQVGDAGDPHLVERVGCQDIVVANNFLCHMAPAEAERCLRNVARLVKRGGYLSIAGIDLDIRAKVAKELGWTPVLDMIEEIHNGDSSVRRDWPWRYWGLEPFDRNRPDWRIRYAAVFRLDS